jgi:hypothetical protein
MNQFLDKNSSSFVARKVSTDQAIRLLGRKGIRLNREKAEIILDFLYLIAKTYKKEKKIDNTGNLNLSDESNT